MGRAVKFRQILSLSETAFKKKRRMPEELHRQLRSVADLAGSNPVVSSNLKRGETVNAAIKKFLEFLSSLFKSEAANAGKTTQRS